MINLLPPQTKEDLLYARRNTKLLRWFFALLLGIAGIIVLTVGGLFYTNQAIQSNTAIVTKERQQLEVQKIGDIQNQVQDISNSLKLVIQVLSQEILFSKLLQQIGAAMPAGSSLSQLSINKTQGGIDLSALAADYQTATQVQINLQDPQNRIFNKADIVSIKCGNLGDSSMHGQYQCIVTLRALFATNNPFLFINNSSVGIAKS